MDNMRTTETFYDIENMIYDKVELLEDNSYNSMSFVGSKDFIKEILRVFLNKYYVNIGVIHIEEFEHINLYRLCIDEDYVVCVEPVVCSNTDYNMGSTDIEFVSEEAPIDYIDTLMDNDIEYDVVVI